MASYLFYSPQLDGLHAGNVPPITQAQLGTPELHPPTVNPPVSDLNLTPQFGSQGYNLPPHAHAHATHVTHAMGTREPEVDVSFLSSPLPTTFGSSGADRQFVPYMPIYTSPYVGPTYSPMLPMMFGVPPESFEPLPETQWAEKQEPQRPYDVRSSQMSQQYMFQNTGPQWDLQMDQPQLQSRQAMGGGRSQQPPGAPQYRQYASPPQPQKSVLDDLRGPGPQHTRAHSLHDIVQECLVADLATDQNGSRFIQTKLEEASPEEKQAVFAQILPETLRLCTDVFGNYCIQKFFEYGTPEQKQQLATKIKNRVLALSLQMYGCRVVQKILESVDGELQSLLIRELDGHVLECVKDQNANHVIQKCIERVPASHQMIQKSFYGRVYDLSTHPYGCRVIQRMLEHCPQDLKNPILEELMTYAEQLAKDQYGNYVLQHVLQHSSMECKDRIINTVAQNILAFSKHKFASNVVERCFVAVDTRHKGVLLNAVIGNSESSPLVSMVRDQYGNYVIQKMLETLNVPQRDKLIVKIAEYVPNIRKIAFGKHIVAKIEKLTGKII